LQQLDVVKHLGSINAWRRVLKLVARRREGGLSFDVPMMLPESVASMPLLRQ
jgi:hypothetical protein